MNLTDFYPHYQIGELLDIWHRMQFKRWRDNYKITHMYISNLPFYLRVSVEAYCEKQVEIGKMDNLHYQIWRRRASQPNVNLYEWVPTEFVTMIAGHPEYLSYANRHKHPSIHRVKSRVVCGGKLRLSDIYDVHDHIVDVVGVRELVERRNDPDRHENPRYIPILNQIKNYYELKNTNG